MGDPLAHEGPQPLPNQLLGILVEFPLEGVDPDSSIIRQTGKGVEIHRGTFIP